MQFNSRCTLIVDQESKGKRVDVFIAQEIDDITRSYARNLIERGLVKRNGANVKKCGECVNANDIIEVELPPVETISAAPEDIALDIIYEDNDIIVINKAQGMVTHPAAGSPSGTLVNALMYRADSLSSINGIVRPGIVHRLDKNTSGLIVVAKNDLAHNSLALQISSKRARRIYIALVDGNIKEDIGTIDKPIARSTKDRKLMSVVPSGRCAVTNYKVLRRYGLYTLVEFELKTGRTHQIRVHAKSIHHPVVGDEVYGGSNRFKLAGQLLHAQKLILEHPLDGRPMQFEAPLPDYFTEVIARLNNTYKED